MADHFYSCVAGSLASPSDTRPPIPNDIPSIGIAENEEKLRAVKVPTLVLHGKNDTLTLPFQAQLLYEAASAYNETNPKVRSQLCLIDAVCFNGVGVYPLSP